MKFTQGEFSENFVPKPTNSHSEPPKVQKNKFQGPPWAENVSDFESKRIPKEDSGKRKPTKKCYFAKVSQNLNCTFQESKAKTPRTKGMSEDPKKVRPPFVSGANGERQGGGVSFSPSFLSTTQPHGVEGTRKTQQEGQINFSGHFSHVPQRPCATGTRTPYTFNNSTRRDVPFGEGSHPGLVTSQWARVREGMIASEGPQRMRREEGRKE